jgi:hypothetical protein
MAVAFDAASASADLSGSTSGSWSHTCSGSDRYLIVGVAGFDAESNLSGITVTYNSVAMTKLGGNQDTNNNNTLLFGLVAPATGSNTVQISNIPSSFSQVAAGAISFTGVHQTTPVGTVQNGANVNTVDVTDVVSGDMVVDSFYDGDNDNANPEGGATKRYSVLMATVARAIGSTRGGSGTVSPTYSTVADPMISAVRINQAAASQFSGTLSAQAAAVSGTVNPRPDFSGTPAAQNSTMSGTVNPRPDFSGTATAQAAQIVGELAFPMEAEGTLASAAAGITGLLAVDVLVLVGALAAQSAVLSAEFTRREGRGPLEVGIRQLGKRRFNLFIRHR